MLTSFQSLSIITLCVAGSLLFMWGLNHVWPREQRREHNDQIGWQLTALGTTYAVILGFMLYAVWTTFGVAEVNVDLEANALVNIYRLSAGLPEPQRDELQRLARSYADTAIYADWPQMAQEGIPNETMEINANMWRTLMSMKTASPTEVIAQDHALYELSALTEHRRTRILQSSSRLPAILWCVLAIGGALTVASACLFGSGNWVLHSLQVFAFSLLIALGLVAIAQINRPFQGSVRVSNYAFLRAQDNMRMP